jgi:hypothetical protein
MEAAVTARRGSSVVRDTSGRAAQEIGGPELVKSSV